MRRVTGRNSQAVTPVLIRFFQGIKNAKSITVDRGREFAKYNEIEQKLGIPVYFAHPYSPEERGSNEMSVVLYRKNAKLKQLAPKN